MAAEYDPNAYLVLQEFYGTDFSTHANTFAGSWDNGNHAVTPYGELLRTALTDSFAGDVAVQVGQKMARIDASLRFGIMSKALETLPEEALRGVSDILLTVYRGDPEKSEDDGLLDLRAYIDKQKVTARLAQHGLTEAPLIDQDALLARITNPENGFAVSFDELLALSELFDPAKSSPEALIDGFNRWQKDPEGGAKVIAESGMAFTVKDFAIGERVNEANRNMPLEDVLDLAETYKSTGAFSPLIGLVSSLLFARAAAGITLYDTLTTEGYQELLLEDEQMLKAYGIALAAHQQFDKAREVAMATTQKYEDYCYIGLEIAKTQLQAGNPQEAIATIDHLATVDPVMNFAHNTTEADHIGMMSGSPTGFMFESFAEQYAACGAWEKAIVVYKKSRQYPEQTEPKLAEAAIAADAEQEYLAAVLGFEGDIHDLVFMTSRLATALLRQLDKRNPVGIALRDTHPSIVTSIRGFTGKLIQQRSQGDDLKKRVINDTLFNLYNLIGDAEMGLHVLQSDRSASYVAMQKFGGLITTLAKQGRYEEALNMFDTYHDQFTDAGSFTYRKANIQLMGWARLQGDNETFYRFYEQLPEYERHRALVDMIRTFSGHDLQLDTIVTHDLIYSGATRTHLKIPATIRRASALLIS